MTEISLSHEQMDLVQAPLDQKIFLEGPTGTGKTTASVARLLHWLASGVPADRVLVLVPQRTLADSYYAALRLPTVNAGGKVNIATVGGLARRMVDLFWPLVSEEAGFGAPDAPPTFLTLETAQYYMARIVMPLIEKGYFEGVSIDRNRLYSQIIDNLNKAAVVGFPYTEIAARLKGAWVGESSQGFIYDQTQECAQQFRRYCLDHNLLDFSLQLHIFSTYLWPDPVCREYLLQSYPYLIVDNIEEDTPVAHDLIYAWLPHASAALVVFDQDAGYRSFLGADTQSAYAVHEMCDVQVQFRKSYVTSAAMAAFGTALSDVLGGDAAEKASDSPPDLPDVERPALPVCFEYHRYHPEMLDWLADEIAACVHNEGIPASEIVVLAPFLSDALRFSLTHRLQHRDVAVRSHRPSRALRDEPAAQALLAFAAIAHPQWKYVPASYDLTYALMKAITDLDLVRAQLLTEVLYRVRDGIPMLDSFSDVKPDMQQRVTYVFGNRYEALRDWLFEYTAQEPLELDHFLARLFGEVLSQPGYGFHRDFDAARVAATLIESVQKFRWISRDLDIDQALGKEYLDMVRGGVIAAQYVGRWRTQPEDAVLLAPAYTFLLSNRPVDVQFWLNVGGRGWSERLYQPLTHPHVLSRHWPVGQLWTDKEEFELRQVSLRRLILGLVRRCRHTVYLGLSELGEQGYEQDGPLLRAMQRVLRDTIQI